MLKTDLLKQFERVDFMKVEKYTQKAIEIANDDRHGYSQYNRWGNPDYDCSSLVISCVDLAGIPVKKNGATYTGNMYKAFINAGFKDVTNTVNLYSGKGLMRGDILLNHTHHTEIYIGNNKTVGAKIDENNGIAGNKRGDNTGREICITNYYNYPWNCVLRYIESKNTGITGNITQKKVHKLAIDVINGVYGNGYERQVKLGKFYEPVQAEVNRILQSKSQKPTVTEIAKRVIKGEFGNGEERRIKLEKMGYNYNEVQKKVNDLLK